MKRLPPIMTDKQVYNLFYELQPDENQTLSINDAVQQLTKMNCKHSPQRLAQVLTQFNLQNNVLSINTFVRFFKMVYAERCENPSFFVTEDVSLNPSPRDVQQNFGRQTLSKQNYLQYSQESPQQFAKSFNNSQKLNITTTQQQLTQPISESDQIFNQISNSSQETISIPQLIQYFENNNIQYNNNNIVFALQQLNSENNACLNKQQFAVFYKYYQQASQNQVTQQNNSIPQQQQEDHYNPSSPASNQQQNKPRSFIKSPIARNSSIQEYMARYDISKTDILNLFCLIDYDQDGKAQKWEVMKFIDECGIKVNPQQVTNELVLCGVRDDNDYLSVQGFLQFFEKVFPNRVKRW